MTILETIPILEVSNRYDNLILISLLIMIISIIIGTLMYLTDCDIAGAICTIIAGISVVIFITGIILAGTEPKIDTGRKQYIIRVNENTSINEIYDKYKVVAHTKYTDVYTVEEITND